MPSRRGSPGVKSPPGETTFLPLDSPRQAVYYREQPIQYRKIWGGSLWPGPVRTAAAAPGDDHRDRGDTAPPEFGFVPREATAANPDRQF
jgi:hypothetical protein